MRMLFQKITHAAAGVDKTIISQCSSAEKSKYSILGTLVYIPLVTGMVAMAFVCSYFTQNALLIALICLGWAGVVFVIERALIAGLRPRRWSWAVPARFILAIAMSCIITELLAIYIFRPDIYSHIAEKNAVQEEQLYSAGNTRVEDLKKELNHHKQLLDAKEKAYLDEIDGRAGTRRHGYGPSAKAKELALKQERAYYEEVKARLQEEMDLAAQQRDNNVTQLADSRKAGLLQCITALYELSAENKNVAMALWIFHIFFLFLEMMPMIIKLSYAGTQYYDILDLVDNQKLEAQKLTTEDSKEVMRLASQCEITQQQIAIQNKMIRMQLQQLSEMLLMDAKTMYGTAMTLEELENHNKSKISESRATKLKEEINKVFERYLQEHENILATVQCNLLGTSPASEGL